MPKIDIVVMIFTQTGKQVVFCMPRVLQQNSLPKNGSTEFHIEIYTSSIHDSLTWIHFTNPFTSWWRTQNTRRQHCGVPLAKLNFGTITHDSSIPSHIPCWHGIHL